MDIKNLAYSILSEEEPFTCYDIINYFIKNNMITNTPEDICLVLKILNTLIEKGYVSFVDLENEQLLSIWPQQKRTISK